MLKKTLWTTVVSPYIRLKYADSNGYVKCVTCGRVYHYKKMQAGHFIHKLNATYFIEMNLHPQCLRCNYYLSGNMGDYRKFMENTYGKDKVEELEITSKPNFKLTDDYLQEVKDYYKPKLDKLLKEIL